MPAHLWQEWKQLEPDVEHVSNEIDTIAERAPELTTTRFYPVSLGLRRLGCSTALLSSCVRSPSLNIFLSRFGTAHFFR